MKINFNKFNGSRSWSMSNYYCYNNRRIADSKCWINECYLSTSNYNRWSKSWNNNNFWIEW